MKVFVYYISSGREKGYYLELDEEKLLEYLSKLGLPVIIEENTKFYEIKARYSIVVLDRQFYSTIL
ncbi:MAG: hypothetical protein JTT12_05485 [Candidatus Brockarchaeota archaeon]|nr:hypothetical protein [Candidatus Brockarchaeota archaeon]